MGFITIDGGELIVLDGQHRLLAMREVITGEKTGTFKSEVANDDVCVIFLQYIDKEKTRRTFNTVNRTARPTSRSDNLITSEDDAYAILARRLMDINAPLGKKYSTSELVNWKNNSLSKRSVELTTVSVVASSVEDILTANGVPKQNPFARPADADLDQWYDLVEPVWDDFLTNIKAVASALKDTKPIYYLREDSSTNALLFKPGGQIALFKGLMIACRGGRMSVSDATKRLNDVDWRMTAPQWGGVLIKESGTIDARSESYLRAAHLIAYLIGKDVMPPEEIQGIKALYNKGKGVDIETAPLSEHKELPEPVKAAR